MEVTKRIMVREKLFVTIKDKEEAVAEEEQTIKDKEEEVMEEEVVEEEVVEEEVVEELLNCCYQSRTQRRRAWRRRSWRSSSNSCRRWSWWSYPRTSQIDGDAIPSAS